MERLRSLARRHSFDVLIVLAAVVAALDALAKSFKDAYAPIDCG